MFKRKVVSRTALGEHHLNLLAPSFRILSRLGSQDGPMLQAKTDPKSIKNRYEKGSNFEGLLEGHNFEKSSILEANMEAGSSHRSCAYKFHFLSLSRHIRGVADGLAHVARLSAFATAS